MYYIKLLKNFTIVLSDWPRADIEARTRPRALARGGSIGGRGETPSGNIKRGEGTTIMVGKRLVSIIFMEHIIFFKCKF